MAECDVCMSVMCVYVHKCCLCVPWSMFGVSMSKLHTDVMCWTYYLYVVSLGTMEATATQG